MKRKLTEQEKTYRARIASNKRLFKKALKDKPVFNASKGKKFLKDVEPGNLVEVSFARAVLIDANDSACSVLVTDYSGSDNTEYYTGQQRWSPSTEVKVIK